jgi:transposase
MHVCLNAARLQYGTPRYSTDVSDDEWAFVAPYLILMTEDTPQRNHSWREVFNGLRWIVRAGATWRLMPHDLPPTYDNALEGKAIEL